MKKKQQESDVPRLGFNSETTKHYKMQLKRERRSRLSIKSPKSGFFMTLAFELIFFAFVFKSNAQTSSRNCLLLDALFNAHQIKSSFHLKYENDSLILLDKRSWFTGECKSFKWGTNSVRLVNDSSILSRIRLKDPYFIFKRNCKTFILDIHRKGVLYYFSILQPCSGLLTEAVIKRHRENFEIISVKKFVL